MMTVMIQSCKGSWVQLRVNKYWSIYTLYRIIIFGLLKRMARKEKWTVTEYAKKMKAWHDRFDIKLTFGENELVETDLLMGLGDGAILRQSFRFIGW